MLLNLDEHESIEYHLNFKMECHKQRPIFIFSSQKILRKEKKNVKENDFLIFDCTMKNTKESQI